MVWVKSGSNISLEEVLTLFTTSTDEDLKTKALDLLTSLSESLDVCFLPESVSAENAVQHMISKGVKRQSKFVDFNKQLSESVQIDGISCYNMTSFFATRNLGLSIADFKSLIEDPKHFDALMDSVSDFCFREKLCRAQCLRSIMGQALCAKQEKNEFESACSRILYEKVVSRHWFKALCTQADRIIMELLIQSSKGSEFNDEKQVWKRLQQIRLLIDMMGLAVGVLEADWDPWVQPIAMALGLLGSLKKTGWGVKLGKHRPKMSEAHQSAVALFRSLCMMLVCQTVNHLLNALKDESLGTAWKEVLPLIQEITKVVGESPGSSSGTEMGFMWLAWSTLLYCVSESELPGTQHLSESALAFAKLAKHEDHIMLSSAVAMLTSPVISECPLLQRIAYESTYGVLDAFVLHFEPESLGPPDELDSLLQVLFKNSSSASLFWQTDFEKGLAALVRDQVYKYPLRFVEPVTLLSALAAASEESARKIMCLLSRLPCYTESLRTVPAAQLGPNANDEDSIYCLKESRKPYAHAEDFIIPRGCEGFVVMAEDESGGFVEWRYAHSGWQVCLIEAQQAFSSGSDRLEAVLKLVLGVVTQEPLSSPGKLVHFIDLFLALLNADLCKYSTTVQQCSPRITTLALDILARAAVGYPDQVLEYIRHAIWLPKLKHKDEERLICEEGLDALCQLGTTDGNFKPLLAYLRLILYVIQGASGNSSVLTGTIVYILRKIWTPHSSWAYEDKQDSMALGCYCLAIFSGVLAPIEKEEGHPLEQANDFCRNSFLYHDAMHPLLSLLRYGREIIAAPGLDSIRIDEAPEGGAEPSGSREVCLALSILSRLLDAPLPSDQLPPLLFHICAVHNHAQPLLLAAISHYVHPRFEARLSKLALLNLRKVAEMFPALIRSTLGDSIPTFIEHLHCMVSSSWVESSLKISALQFIAMALKRQSALRNLLLFGTDSAEKGGTKGGCLHSLWKILEAAIEGDTPPPEEVLRAALAVVYEIWESNIESGVAFLTAKTRFWEVVALPLFVAPEELHLALLEAPMRILANAYYRGCFKSGASETHVLKRFFQHSDRVQAIFELIETSISQRTVGSKLLAWRALLKLVLGPASNVTSAPINIPVEIKTLILTRSFGLLQLSFVRCEVPLEIRRTLLEMTYDLLSCSLDCLEKPSWCEIEPSLRWIVEEALGPQLVESRGLDIPSLVYLLSILASALPQLSLHQDDALAAYVVTVCQFLAWLSLKHDQCTDGRQLLQFEKCVEMCILCLKELVESLDPEAWLTVFQRKFPLRSAFRLLQSSVERRQLHGNSNLVFKAIISFFSVLSGAAKVLPMIEESGLTNYVCLNLPHMLMQESEDPTWSCEVLEWTFSLYLSFLKDFKDQVVESALSLTGAYSDIIIKETDIIRSHLSNSVCLVLKNNLRAQVLERGSTSLVAKDLGLCQVLLSFLSELARYHRIWITSLPHVCRIMLKSVGKFSSAIISVIVKPTWLQHQLKERKRLRGPPTSAMDNYSFIDINRLAMECLLECVQLLIRFSPTIVEGTSPTFDAESWDSVVGLDDSSTSNLTFPILISAMHFSIGALRRGGGSGVGSAQGSRSPDVPGGGGVAQPLSSLQVQGGESNQPLVLVFLEECLVLITAQILLYIRYPTLPAGHTAYLKREIAPDIRDMISRCLRGSVSSPGSSRKSPTPYLSATALQALDIDLFRDAFNFFTTLSAATS